MLLFNSAPKSNFGGFYCNCLMFSVANYAHGQVEIYCSVDLILYAEHHSRVPRLSANMDTIYWGKGTIAREPSNEHDPYAVAVLENVGKEQQVALASALQSPRPPGVAVASTTRGGWDRGGNASAWTGMQLGHEELCAKSQPGYYELYAGQEHKNDTRSF